MNAPSEAELKRLSGANVSRESLVRLTDYVALLRRWQARINLIGNSTVDDIWKRHVADALQLMPLVDEMPSAVVDLGAGAGIPGLPLALAWKPEHSVFVHLIESNGKKAAFLREALRVTELPGEVHHMRIASVVPNELRPFPRLVVARAVAPLSKLLGMAKPFVDKGAVCLFHKGQDVDDELTTSTKYWRISHRLHASRLQGGGSIVEVKEIESVAKPQ